MPGIKPDVGHLVDVNKSLLEVGGKLEKRLLIPESFLA